MRVCREERAAARAQSVRGQFVSSRPDGRDAVLRAYDVHRDRVRALATRRVAFRDRFHLRTVGGAPNMYSEKPPYSENHFLPAAGDENFGIPLPSFPYLPMSIFCASVLISDILFWPYSMSLTTLFGISTRTLVCTCWLSHSGFTTAKAKTLAK